MQGYKVLRNNLFIKMWYHPKVIGRQKIPKSGSVIFCGNHLESIDDKLVTCSAGRIICWENFLNSSSEIALSADEIAYANNGGSFGFFADNLTERYQEIKLQLNILEQMSSEISNNNSFRSCDPMTAKDINNQELAKMQKELEEERLKLINLGINIDDIFVPSFSEKVISLAYETGACIVPFAIEKGTFHTTKISFGDSFFVYDQEEGMQYLNESIKKLFYQNQKHQK